MALRVYSCLSCEGNPILYIPILMIVGALIWEGGREEGRNSNQEGRNSKWWGARLSLLCSASKVIEASLGKPGDEARLQPRGLPCCKPTPTPVYESLSTSLRFSSIHFHGTADVSSSTFVKTQWFIALVSPYSPRRLFITHTQTKLWVCILWEESLGTRLPLV